LIGAEKIFKLKYARCKEDTAWDPIYEIFYKNCTEDISKGDPLIFSTMNDIEVYANSPQYSQNNLWHISKEAENLEENGLNGLEKAVTEIKHVASRQKIASTCQQECLKRSREVTIMLVLIKWGYFGPAEAPAGQYIAHHRANIGPYFINSVNNSWPYYPLHNPPSNLELSLNNILMKFTEEMLQVGVSLLDLPGFGTKATHLDDTETNEANWPIEVNFALYNRTQGNMSTAFKQLKEMTQLWQHHMANISEHRIHSMPMYHLHKMQNPYNYSEYIRKDLSTFVRIVAGSFPTAWENDNQLWRTTAKKVFNDTVDENYNSERFYDKLIIQCSFQNRLEKNSGGCELFSQSVTNNGLCQTFNGVYPSSIWHPSQLTDGLENFLDNYQSLQNYGGAGANEGNILLLEPLVSETRFLKIHDRKQTF
jgi:hypothetical protein